MLCVLSFSLFLGPPVSVFNLSLILGCARVCGKTENFYSTDFSQSFGVRSFLFGFSVKALSLHVLRASWLVCAFAARRPNAPPAIYAHNFAFAARRPDANTAIYAQPRKQESTPTEPKPEPTTRKTENNSASFSRHPLGQRLCVHAVVFTTCFLFAFRPYHPSCSAA